MTADLDTLLRDAGRGPTTDLDVDSVHARGRRRATGRRLAAGMGCLALLAVVGVGIATLVDPPGRPVVDQAPDTAPSVVEEEAEATSGSAALWQDQALARRLGVATVRIVDDGRGPDVVRAGFGPEPSLSQYGTSTTVPLWGATVGGDGAVWFADDDQRLLVLPGTHDRPYVGNSMTEVVREAEPGVEAWRVLGPDGAGGVLVGRLATGPDGETFTLHRAEGTTLGAPEPGHGDLLGHIDGDGTPFAAASTPETPDEVVVVDAIGESYGLTILQAGADPTTAFGSGGIDHWLGEVVVAGRHALVVEAGTDGDADLLVYDLDDGELRRVATPIGRTHEGYVLELSAAAGDEGTYVALSAGSDAGPGASWIVDVAALTAAAEPTEPMAPGPDLVADLWEPTGLAGHLSLLPRPDGAAAPVGRCATGPYAQELDTQAVDAVWFPCAGSGGEDRPVSFFPVERLAGVDFATEAARLEAYLDALLEGPTHAEQALGIEAVASSGLVSVSEVAVDGAIVTVDLDPGPDVEALGAVGPSFETAVAGVVLQFIGYDEVVLTLNGSCEAWAALRDADGCRVLTEDDAPWS